MMSLSLTPRLRQTLVCGVCQQVRDAEKAQQATEDVILYGQEPFATCPCCHQKVVSFRDPDYQERARTYFEKGHEMTTDSKGPQKNDVWEDLDPRKTGRQIKILDVQNGVAICKRVDDKGPTTKIRADRFRASLGGKGKKGYKLVSSQMTASIVRDLNANLRSGVDLGT